MEIYQISKYVFKKIDEKAKDLEGIAIFADSISEEKNLWAVGSFESYQNMLMAMQYDKNSHWGFSGLPQPMVDGFLRPYMAEFASGIKVENVQQSIDRFYEKHSISDILKSRDDPSFSMQIWDGDINCYRWAIVPDLLLACALGKISHEKAIVHLDRL